jgi:hypothetical protein
MAKTTKHWKRGRGKLGIRAPLMGAWKTATNSPMGPVKCTRTFTSALGNAYIQLTARWEFGKGIYEEIAMIGVNAEGKIAFWSFTSDGKNSYGTWADVSDVHPEAIGFEAQMPAGLARMIYWPDDADGFYRLKVFTFRTIRWVKKRRPNLKKTLAENIRSYRLAKGLSQEKLAEVYGLHRTFIGSVERAERNVTLDYSYHDHSLIGRPKACQIILSSSIFKSSASGDGVSLYIFLTV